jgi:transposase
MTQQDYHNEKQKLLQQHGSLNPEPEAVKDELFLEKDFFDPNDLAQVKYEMLRRVEKEGHSVSRAVESFGFSRPAFYQIRNNFKQEGLVGLLPKKRGPQKPYKLTSEVMQYIEELLTEDNKTGFEELARKIKKRFSISVHPRSIRRVLAHRKKNTSKKEGSS